MGKSDERSSGSLNDRASAPATQGFSSAVGAGPVEQQRRVLLYEPLHDDAIALLSTVAEISFPDNLEQDTLIEAARGVSGIIVRGFGEITAEVMDAAGPRLSAVARHGAGVENIDVDAATKRRIYVINTPEANVEAVAEHCVGMMIVLSKRMLVADRALRRGEWEARYTLVGQELQGKTLGIVGLGRIGQRVGSICHLAFGMPILYSERRELPSEVTLALGAQRTTLEELLQRSDYVSINVPLLPSTHGLIGTDELALMKPTAFLLNLSRGPVVDEAALVDALREGVIAGAGLDVFEVEPTPGDHPLFEMDNVAVTPHMAAITEESMWRMGMVVRDVMRVWEGGTPEHWVNRW